MLRKRGNMIRIKIIKGLDLAQADAELYLTLSVKGTSKTSKIIGRESYHVPRPAVANDEVPLQSGSPSPSPNKVDDGSVGSSSNKREPTLPKQLGWVWDEELDLVLAPDVKRDDDDLEVSCFDAQFKPCGKVRIPLVRLAPNESTQQWYSLTGSSNPKAAVMLKLTFIPDLSLNSSTSPLRTTSKSPSEMRDDNSTPDVRPGSGNDINILYGLADYFIVAGCNQQTARQDRLRMLAKPRKKPHNIQHHTVAQMGNEEYSQASVIGPESVTLAPILLDRYPPTDRPDFEFPKTCEMFLLPEGAEIVKSVPKTAQTPRFYTIVLVMNTVRTYGFCLEVFEPLPRVNEATDYEDLYAPVVLCYLTRLPLPNDLFRNLLMQTYESRKRGWYERVVQSVTQSIPVPLPGVYSVDLTLLTNEKFRATLPASTDLPALVFPGMGQHAFDWFHLDAIIDLWIAALTERKILVHSYNREALAIVTETLVELMYPFSWEHTYIPVLPINLMQLFDAPIPAIMGMRTDGLKHIPNGGLDALSEHWIIVDADKCIVSFPKHEPLPRLPVELRARLFRTLRMILVDKRLAEDAKDRKIRLAFLECIASMLQGYRESFFVLSTDADASTVFNLNQFFQRQSSQKIHAMSQMTTHIQHPAQSNVGDSGREFLETFFGTTGFEQFKISQYQPSTDFFHAVYAARRSKERERDQRSAALAALQSEAESAAALQQQQTQNSSGTANASAASMKMTTVVKIWTAREARWSESALEPIDPAGGRRRSSVAYTEVVEARPPLVSGDRVFVKPFGIGTLLDYRTDDHVCKIQMDWGATVYVQIESVSNLTEEWMPRLLPQVSPKAKRNAPALNDDRSEDESVIGENGETNEAEMLPIKTVPARFLHDTLSLVDEAVLRRIIKDNLDSACKAEAQLRRMLGTPDEPRRSQSAANRQPKSATDAKMERLMHRAISNIFQDKFVPENDLKECANNLANSQYARDILVYVLKSQQLTHVNNSTSGGSWLATPGRGRRLGSEAFASLHELYDALLKACAVKEDYSNGGSALEVSQYFYCDDETLQSRLRGHLLWSKPVFWEYAFAEHFAKSLEKERSLPTPPTISTDQTPMEPPAVALARFHERAKVMDPGEEDARKQTLFEHLSFFLHTMLNLDVSDEMARVFVDRIATIYGLEEELKMTLNMLITNISRAALYNLEEERMQSQAHTSVDDGQASPNSSAKRNLRKHYSVEAISNTMMSRFTRWGRSTKSTRSPNQSSGRRDSLASQDH